MRAEAKPLCWVRKPGDDSHSLICDTVSSCRIFFAESVHLGAGF